jgi:flagellar biosynthesis GTPase FlhF
MEGNYIVFVKNRSNNDFYIANRKQISSVIEIIPLPYLSGDKVNSTTQQTSEEKISRLQEEISKLRENLLAKERKIQELELLAKEKKEERPIPLRDKLFQKLLDETKITDIDENSFVRIEQIIEWKQNRQRCKTDSKEQPSTNHEYSFGKEELSGQVSRKTLEILNKHGFVLVEDLVNDEDLSWYSIKGIGYKSIGEIYRTLAGYWYSMYKQNVGKKKEEQL